MVKPNPNPNPNSRNDQERDGVGIRKSFNGYPFAKSSIVSQSRSFTPNTPVNSPAESARRSSFGRECGISVIDHEQKENERDQNLKPVARVRSPSMSKVTKNFMSPTISAASKINPSPRKKVLGERNEAIRTSASLSEGKFHFYSTSSLEFGDGNESNSTILDFDKLSNEVSNSEVEIKVANLSPQVGKIESESDLVVLSPEISLKTTNISDTLPHSDMPEIIADHNVSLDNKSTTYSSPSIIAPLDADPSYQPYDPKNNFLSPRPQFLHYKPNPRIESYINEGLKFEDEFTSDSVSESENSEETESENSQEAREEEASSSVETSSVDEVRPMCGGKLKALSLLLFILLGYVSFALYSHGVGNAMYQDAIFPLMHSNPHLASYLAKANFNDVLQNAKLWSVQSVGYMSHMVFKASEIQFSPLPFSNLTSWQEEETEYYLVKGFESSPSFAKKEDEIEDSETEMPDDHEAELLEQSSGILPLTDQAIDFEPEKLEQYSLVEDEDSLHEDENIVLEEQPEKLEQYSLVEAELLEQSSGILPLTDQVIDFEPEKLEQYSLVEDEDSLHEDENIVLEEQPEKLEQYSLVEDEDSLHEDENIVLEETVTNDEKASFDEPEYQEAANHEEHEITSPIQDESQSEFKVAVDTHSQVTTTNEPLNIAIIESKENEEVKGKASIAALIVSLLAAIGFMFAKKSKKEKPAHTPLASEIDPKKVHDNPSSSTGPVEVDMNESIPSEMSSFQKTSSYNKRDQSVETSSKRNYKRESLASSSSEYTTMSASYGSFTTYSVLHPKNGDDEVVTPVRRSSRIRSKVTSP